MSSNFENDKHNWHFQISLANKKKPRTCIEKSRTTLKNKPAKAMLIASKNIRQNCNKTLSRISSIIVPMWSRPLGFCKLDPRTVAAIQTTNAALMIWHFLKKKRIPCICSSLRRMKSKTMFEIRRSHREFSQCSIQQSPRPSRKQVVAHYAYHCRSFIKFRHLQLKKLKTLVQEIMRWHPLPHPLTQFHLPYIYF